MKQTIRRVYIEITSRCNLQCSFCTAPTRQQEEMDVAFFRQIISQVREITPYVYLHVQGEPLLHRQFDEIMTVCDENRMQVQLVTNGTLLNRFDLLKHSSLRKISFSMQSIEFHNHDAIAFLQEILSFAEKASAQGRPVCEIRFWRDDQLHSPRTEACIEWLKKNYPMAVSGRRDNYELMKNVYADFHNSFVWPSMDQPEKSCTGTCLGALTQIAVLCDGTVVPCCLDAEGVIRLGSLIEMTLPEILAGERYIKICEGFRNHRLEESLCRRCTFRERFSQ